MKKTATIFDFTTTSNLEDWRIVDDGVMGGRSAGTFYLNDAGQGVFEGEISLKNYGGFSSVRYNFKTIEVDKYTKVILKVKGDGKPYQFRIKANTEDYFSYVSTFSTNGGWQEIEIELKDMYPSFRGRRLNEPNFSADAITGLTILFGNKKEEDFRLLLDQISLK